MEVQTVLVPKSEFKTKKAAISWVESHGYKNNKIDTSVHYWRFRQEPPSKYREFKAVTLPNKVMLIRGKPFYKK